MRIHNFYAGVRLDRADALRGDTEWIAAQLTASTTRVLPLWRSQHLVTADIRPVWLPRDDAAGLLDIAEHVVFLGLEDGVAHVTVDISHHETPESLVEIAERGTFRDLREFGPLLARHEGAVLAYARGLLHWHRRHLFCGVCGAATESTRGGHVRLCGNESCGTQHFPRTDPAVIMLIHDGAGACVLGRQASWPPGMHSTLAGFVEPGESLEEAVAREIQEEVGLKVPVNQIVYHSSQPWPFPSSLMLGFHAHCRRADLKVDPVELESAAWFSRDELLNSPEDEKFKLPRKDSIARRLIEDWLAEV